MKKWMVTAAVTGGAYLGEVEAETVDEALAKAGELGRNHSLGLCWQCSDRVEELELGEISVEEQL